MAETKYPDLSISDDWNERTPKPVTSFAADVEKAKNEPTLGLFHDPETGDFVETSAGAVPADSDTAKAAADVAMKEPKSADEPDEPVKAKRVAPKSTQDS